MEDFLNLLSDSFVWAIHVPVRCQSPACAGPVNRAKQWHSVPCRPVRCPRTTSSMCMTLIRRFAVAAALSTAERDQVGLKGPQMQPAASACDRPNKLRRSSASLHTRSDTSEVEFRTLGIGPRARLCLPESCYAAHPQTDWNECPIRRLNHQRRCHYTMIAMFYSIPIYFVHEGGIVLQFSHLGESTSSASSREENYVSY
jgi:hypothetical protein